MWPLAYPDFCGPNYSNGILILIKGTVVENFAKFQFSLHISKSRTFNVYIRIYHVHFTLATQYFHVRSSWKKFSNICHWIPIQRNVFTLSHGQIWRDENTTQHVLLRVTTETHSTYCGSFFLFYNSRTVSWAAGAILHRTFYTPESHC